MIKNTQLHKIFGTILFVLGSLVQSKPNIIFFLVDDMGLHDTSVPFGKDTSAQNRWFETPVMESLAKSGVKFTRAYAHSVCSPSRISLLTGKNAVLHKVTNWTLFKDRDQSQTSAQLKSPAWEWNGFDVKDSAAALPSIIRDQGYRTIHAGKAHFGVHGDANEDPKNLGFDVNIAGHASGGPGSYSGLENYSAMHRCNCPEWDVPGLEEFHGKNVHLTEALTIRAKREILAAHQMGKPFYLYMAHYAIHAPWIRGHEPYLTKFRAKRNQHGKNDGDAIFASLMEGTDVSLGELITYVDSLGIGENTLIIFTSDNGGARTNAPLRAKKGTQYEGGLRVPLIISWAKNSNNNPFPIAPNSVSNKNVIIEDYFPTLIQLAGGEMSTSVEEYQEGQNILPFITNPSNSKRFNERLYFHYPHKHNGPHASAMIKEDMKVIYFYENNRWELYDVMKDIGEQNNLASTNTRELYIMAKELENGLEARGVQYPIQKSDNQERKLSLPSRPSGLTEGCLDERFSEFDAGVDIHDQEQCLTLGVPLFQSERPAIKFEGGFAFLNNKRSLSLKFFNLKGGSRGSQEIHSSGIHKIRDLNSGIYFVVIKDKAAGNQWVQKIVYP